MSNIELPKNSNMPKLNLEAKANWGPIREAFMQESPTPTYTELGERFGIDERLVGRIARDENWPEQRLKLQNAQLQAIGAGEVLAQAITAEKQVVSRAKQVAIKLLDKLEDIIEKVAVDESSVRKHSDILNTVGFAMNNVCKSMKELGVVGFPKELADAGKLGNGHWDPKLLNQINVTIQGLNSESKVKQVDRSEPTVKEQSDLPPPSVDAVDVMTTSSDQPSTATDDAQSKQAT